MAWDKPDDSTYAFECDTCSAVEEVNVETAKIGARDTSQRSDFNICWEMLRGIGWRTFKRTGKDWSHSCIKCGAEAEVTHRQHRRDERERERIRAHNETTRG